MEILILLVIVAVAIFYGRNSRRRGSTWRCPACRETIPFRAHTCSFCRTEMTPVWTARDAAAS
jgi:hypothetical protein